jgi:hypothetical protein
VSELAPSDDEAPGAASEPIPSVTGPGAPARRVDSPRPWRSTRRRRRLPPMTTGAHRYLVLACRPEDTVAIDLGTGAVTRLRVAWGEGSEPDLAPFEVVDATLSADPERDDLAQPEAVTVSGEPSRVGSLGGRRARRIMRHVVAPVERHLLGFPGTSAPYWEFRGMRPSVAVVVPSRGPLLFRRRDDSVWVRFGWPTSDNWLAVEDRRAVAALWTARRDRLSGRDLAAALGYRPHFLVVALSPPVAGHCYKTVAAILPRP